MPKTNHPPQGWDFHADMSSDRQEKPPVPPSPQARWHVQASKPVHITASIRSSNGRTKNIPTNAGGAGHCTQPRVLFWSTPRLHTAYASPIPARSNAAPSRLPKQTSHSNAPPNDPSPPSRGHLTRPLPSDTFPCFHLIAGLS